MILMYYIKLIGDEILFYSTPTYVTISLHSVPIIHSLLFSVFDGADIASCYMCCLV